jgi:hypothetical protein
LVTSWRYINLTEKAVFLESDNSIFGLFVI